MASELCSEVSRSDPRQIGDGLVICMGMHLDPLLRKHAKAVTMELKAGQASRPCVGCTIRTGGTPVPLLRFLANVHPGVHVWRAAEIPEHGRAFNLPHVPHAVVAD